MKNELFFSVIVPTYNRADFIAVVIDSVLTQRYQHFELIVVDDGSTDDTFSVFSRFNDKRLRYERIPNSERGAARNHGVRVSKGDYVTFVDSDDIIYPHYLTNACRCLLENGRPEFFHQNYEVRSSTGQHVRYTTTIRGDVSESLVKGNPLSCLGVFVERQTALRFPFLEDRNLSGSEDWELWLRLSANYGIVTSEKVCACLIIHEDRSVLGVDENKLVMRKNLALHYAFQDPRVQEVYGSSRSRMEAYCDTYISLHLVLAGVNRHAPKYLWLALRSHFPAIFKRRVLAITKYYILNFFRKSA
ncbi:MAG: hypothetical protein RLZZ630_1136 [Bacteroidota bacterium]|jgi:glycosyltransferase involved in cell wall biosynthesis